jgi:putative aldouronate transport system substrate-binding protein
MKKLLCMLLALVMVLGFASAFAEGKTYYGGYTDMIDATVAIYQRSSQGDAENIWWWDFCREYFGINFTVTQLTSTGEYKSTAFASGDMPDVFYQLFLDSSSVVEQGVTNHNLVALDEYITPEFMPNLSRIYAAYPEYKTAITASDGHIYCLGVIQNAASPLMTFYYNQRWLDDAGLDVPTTLDEFTEVMAAFKDRENLPENEGKTIVPLTGDLGNQPRFIANAFGWITDSAGYLTAVALDDVNGTPCFIYADEERFPAFMEIMKEYIELGYFSADVFDDQYAGNQTAQQKAEDLTGFDQNTSNAIDPNEWTAAIPLTSEWNDEPAIARSYNAINCQSFAIGNREDMTEEKIERLMVWVDWLYDYDNYLMSHWGPSAEETEYLYGLKSGYTTTMNEETGKWVYSCKEVEDGDFTSFGDYQNRRIQGIIGGYLGLNVDLWGEATRNVNPPSYNNKVDENVLPYLVDTYPNIRFFDAATNERISELRTEINNYVNEQYVAFISGEKEINEENLAEYFQTIKDLGYEEYVQYFIDYYEAQ